MSEIRIITEPSVFLIGRQEVDGGELQRFLEHVGAAGWTTDAPSAAETLVEVSSRNCYASYNNPRPGGNAAHIGHILEVGHGSVCEHAVWTILITGISRSLTHELIRHRVGISPSQLSQRFYDESDAAFVVPPMIDRACHFEFMFGEIDRQKLIQGVRSRWFRSMQSARSDYISTAMDLESYLKVAAPDLSPTLRRKRAREAARSVLPNCVETRIALTGNARAWRHVLAMRGDEAADLEIRRLAVTLAPRLKAEAPNLFSDVTVGTGDDGFPVVKLDYSKV